jgi:hypothetical protein
MRRGDFDAAWRESDRGLPAIPDDEWRRPRHLQRLWRGQPIEGQRVLVRCYRGLGDTVQFLRYLPLVGAAARHVTVWVQPALIPLAALVRGADCILPLHDGDPGVEADVDVEIMELAHVFRTRLDTIPGAVPYLRLPDPARTERASPGQPRIGIAWRAGDWDLDRSVPAALAAAVLRDVDGEIVVLQRELHAPERRWFAAPGPSSLLEVARCIAGLDLVITVDTVFAHLAGALGRPTWLLLQAEADWRWLHHRDDSPWYPTMRLFRQPSPGAWDPVMAHVSDALGCGGGIGRRVIPGGTCR